MLKRDPGAEPVGQHGYLPYCTDTVTPFWLVCPPIDTSICKSPDGALAGIWTLSYIVPAASPAYT